MKVRKFIYKPEDDYPYLPAPRHNSLEITVEVDGQVFQHRSLVHPDVPFHAIKERAFREIGFEIARKLESQV